MELELQANAARELAFFADEQSLAVEMASEGESVLAIVKRVYEQMQFDATISHRELEFSQSRLALCVRRMFGVLCPFCGAAFSEDDFGIVWDVPAPSNPFDLIARHFTLRNVIVCCELCAVGKADLHGHVWRDVVGVLAANGEAGEDQRKALANGRLELGHAEVVRKKHF